MTCSCSLCVSLGSMSVQSEMKRFGEFDTVALKQHFGKKIMELEDEKKTVQVKQNILEYAWFFEKTNIYLFTCYITAEREGSFVG